VEASRHTPSSSSRLNGILQFSCIKLVLWIVFYFKKLLRFQNCIILKFAFFKLYHKKIKIGKTIPIRSLIMFVFSSLEYRFFIGYESLFHRFWVDFFIVYGSFFIVYRSFFHCLRIVFPSFGSFFHRLWIIFSSFMGRFFIVYGSFFVYIFCHGKNLTEKKEGKKCKC